MGSSETKGFKRIESSSSFHSSQRYEQKCKYEKVPIHSSIIVDKLKEEYHKKERDSLVISFPDGTPYLYLNPEKPCIMSLRSGKVEITTCMKLIETSDCFVVWKGKFVNGGIFTLSIRTVSKEPKNEKINRKKRKKDKDKILFEGWFYYIDPSMKSFNTEILLISPDQ